MLDDYVTLGPSALRVSRMALGSYNFGGGRDWEVADEAAHAIIDCYRALGGNFIDTANVYGDGEAEKIIGDHFAGQPATRDAIVIASKFTSNTIAGDPNSGGAHRKAIRRACETSLRRLRTDYIDLYWMHMWDRLTPIEETMRALEDLVREGKVLHIGLSNIPAWKAAEVATAARLRGSTPVTALQLQYSLLERSIESELIPMAEAFGMGLCPWSPLKSGALAGRFTREALGGATGGRALLARRALDERGFAIVDKVLEIAKAHRVPPARVSLAWLYGRPGVTSILLGADTPDELEENVAAVALELNEGERSALDQISKPALRYPEEFLLRAPKVMLGGTRVNGISA